MKVIIAGSRDITDQISVFHLLDDLVPNGVSEVVSGTAPGMDRLGEAWATWNGRTVKRFPADWDSHGKKAGYIRNAEMADYADALVAIWDGKSRGTKNMIEQALKKGLKLWVVTV